MLSVGAPVNATPIRPHDSPGVASAAGRGLPGLVHVGNTPGAEASQLKTKTHRPGCLSFASRLLGIGNSAKQPNAGVLQVAFHGTDLRSAIDLIRSGPKDLGSTAQHTNLAAGRFCVALDPDAASGYARDRLGGKGSIAAVMAITPKDGPLDIQEQTECGALEPISGNGHDAEFSVCESLYDDLDVKWDSILCNVGDKVATFRVLGARVSEMTPIDGVPSRELSLSLREQSQDENKDRLSTLVLDIRTARPVRWGSAAPSSPGGH